MFRCICLFIIVCRNDRVVVGTDVIQILQRAEFCFAVLIGNRLDDHAFIIFQMEGELTVKITSDCCSIQCQTHDRGIFSSFRCFKIKYDLICFFPCFIFDHRFCQNKMSISCRICLFSHCIFDPVCIVVGNHTRIILSQVDQISICTCFIELRSGDLLSFIDRICCCGCACSIS